MNEEFITKIIYGGRITIPYLIRKYLDLEVGEWVIVTVRRKSP